MGRKQVSQPKQQKANTPEKRNRSPAASAELTGKLEKVTQEIIFGLLIHKDDLQYQPMKLNGVKGLIKNKVDY